MAALIMAQAEWGLYWLSLAARNPDLAPACHHNSAMNALHLMALEAAYG